MHNAVLKFVKEVKGELSYKFRLRNILEVGAHNINGSVRKYFWFCRWTGIDITPGKGVTAVGQFKDIPLIEKYEVVVSTEMLEHDRDYVNSLKKMYEVLEDGGLMIITCAGPHRKPHGTSDANDWCSPDTNDYYRNISVEDFESVLPQYLFDEYCLQYARGKSDLQFYGLKREQHITSKEIYSKLLKRKGENV